MDISPLVNYRKPKYPNKQIVLMNPNILKALPERWKGNLYIGVALPVLLTLTLTACGQKAVPGTGDVTVKGKAPDKSVAINAVVAPVFEHGNGRGSFGCVSIAPPSFLSEEEAYQVIQEEASKYGITFERNVLKMKDVELPETKYYLKPENNTDPSYKNDAGAVDSVKKGNLQLDGYDADKKVAYEFISQEDYDKWCVAEGVYSSVSDYDFLSTAKLLKDGINGKNGETWTGIFYNTMTNLSPDEVKAVKDEQDIKALEVKVKDVAEDELRNQARDFMEWLKAQGIV